jgi:fructose-1,6-bisphosphatase/inositol monophosphatase family enzyme
MIREGLSSRAVLSKFDGSDLTDVDVAINEYVVNEISGRFPGHQVLGEEGGTMIDDLDRPTWVVDPVDGTFPYVAGIGVACFSVALVVDGAARVAVVVDPFTGAVWQATDTSETTRLGQVCAVSRKTSVRGANIDVGGRERVGLFSYLDALGARTTSYRATVRAGAAVADGGFDALTYGGGKAWDVAAVSLLIERAGGFVGHADGSFCHLAGPVGKWVGACSREMFDAVAEGWVTAV